METAQMNIAQDKTQNSRKEIIISITCALLILLWTYTAFSKLSDIQEFKRQLGNQTFSKATSSFLFWFIPISELLAAGLLIIKKTRLIGLVLSSALMLLFTAYITLVLIGYYDRVPCSCGGVLKAMGWQTHLWFNLFFLSISITGLFLYGKSHRAKTNKNANPKGNQNSTASDTQTKTTTPTRT